MHATINWKDEITTIAGPIGTNDSRDSWLLRAARKAHITEWHTKALFYGTLKDPKWSVAYKVLSAADRARLEGAKRDAERAAIHYRLHAEKLAAIDPDFHRVQIDALLARAGVAREPNSS